MDESTMGGAQDKLDEHTGPLENKIEQLKTEMNEKDEDIVLLKRRIREQNLQIEELKCIKGV